MSLRRMVPGALVYAVVAGCSSGATGTSTVARIIEAASVSGQYAYAFDPSGLSTAVGDATASYAIARAGDVLHVGSSAYHIDALGRVDAIDNVTMAYGPDGQIAKVARGSDVITYLYDENGQRILKSTNGKPTVAFLDKGTLTEDELDEPVSVGNKVVGVLRNGSFALSATDTRGTVQADTDGTTRLASPFGARSVHPDVAATVDYAAKGFDADVEAERMGVRDYDARTGRFLQPDPLFLEHPDECIKSPVECNLYGYAVARPLDFVDPDGRKIAFENDASLEFLTDVMATLAYLSNSPTSMALLKKLVDDPKVILIRAPTDAERRTHDDFMFRPNVVTGGGELIYNSRSGLRVGAGKVQTPALGFGHEASHAVKFMTDPNGHDQGVEQTDPAVVGRFHNGEEMRANVEYETPAAKELGEPTRNNHGGKAVDVACPTCTK